MNAPNRVPFQRAGSWFARYDADDRDRQIASDAKRGKLTPYGPNVGFFGYTKKGADGTFNDPPVLGLKSGEEGTQAATREKDRR